MNSALPQPRRVVADRMSASGRTVFIALAFGIAYVTVDWVSYIHPMQQYGITPWNPQPALAIALMMIFGRRWLVAVFAAALFAEWWVRGGAAGWPSTVVVSGVLAGGYAVIAHALSGRFAVAPALDTRRDVLRLVGVVASGALATGVLYVAVLIAIGIGPHEVPLTALVRFWIGHAVGILVTLPFVLMLSVPHRRAEMLSVLRRPETLAHAAATAIALLFVFGGPASEQVKRFYFLFLPLILVAVRYGLVGATLATLVIQVTVIVSGELAGYQPFTVFEFQSLLISLTVTGLFLGVTVDERRRAEEDLRRTMRLAAAGEMAAALAHELNQPLTALSTYARAGRMMAAESGGGGPLLLQTLDKLVGESTRAAEVVRRLRDFFRTGATRLVLGELGQVATRAVEMTRARAEAQGVAVSLRVGEAVPPVRLDEVQMEIVLRNLLANAIEAAAAGRKPGTVEMSIGIAGPATVRVEVLDSGDGVKAADAGRIFEPFETTRATGMGMGLAISRAIVEAHGGSLWVEPGPRGRFCFTLPVSEPPHA